MLAPRQEIARLQSDFYRDQFRKMLRWLMYSIGIIYILIGVIVYVIVSQPAQRYYGNTTEGKIFEMKASG